MQFSSSSSARKRLSGEAENTGRGRRDQPLHTNESDDDDERQKKTARRTRGDEPEASEVQRKPEKKFAWMDSGDEDGDDDAAASSEEDLEADDEVPAPVSAVDVHTLSQMMRFMQQFPRAKLLRLPMAECAAVCEAAARVRYYDASVFGDLASSIRVHLRSRSPLDPAHIVAVVAGLADVNAYDKEVFELASQAIDRCKGQIERGDRRKMLDACKKVKHDSKYLKDISMQEGAARYEDAKSDVAACWQKAGQISSAAMPLGLR
jgi:hypothetical protein